MDIFLVRIKSIGLDFFFFLNKQPVRAEEEANRLNEKFNSYGIPAIPATYAKLEWRREPQV